LESILLHITNLKKKVSLLVSRYTDLNNENTKLKQDNFQLLERISKLDMEMKELKKRVEVVDVMKGISLKDSTSIDVAKSRVNNLIRDIDKCITLLND